MINVTKTDLPALSQYNKLLKKIWKNHWVTNDGDLVRDLAEKLSRLLEVDDLVLLNNATSGLLIALKSLNLKGEVITTPFTFAASTNAILWEGLTPVFADINPKTFNIDPSDVERKIGPNTSAILAVHVYGNPCNVEELTRIARKYNLKLIFDAAHAFYTEYKNKPILHSGDISILSFHATKIFNTIEGGALFSPDKKLMNEFKLYRNFGIKSEDEVLLPGINAKMNEFQAAMGLASIPSLKRNIACRKKIYEYYRSKLRGCNFQELNASRYNYSYMPAIFRNKELRDDIYDALLKKGIKSRKYFYPLTSNFPFVSHSSKDKLPNANQISNGVLCLPIYPSLEIRDAERIIATVNKLT